MKKTVTLLMILTVFSNILAFSRDVILSFLYGASNISDAYLISIIVPSVIFEIIGLGIAINYVPLYTSSLKENGDIAANDFTNNLVTSILIMSTLVLFVVQIFTVPIVKLFAFGFDKDTLNLAVDFTRISIFGIYFTGLMFVFKPFLEIKEKYLTPIIITFITNIVIIVSIILSRKFNIILLSLGSVLAGAIQLILFIPFTYKKGYKFQFKLDLNNKDLKRLIYLCVPVILGASVGQINLLIDKTIASHIVEGGISALNYASKLNVLVITIFVAPLITVIYPMISNMVVESNNRGLKKVLSESVININLFVIPATVGVMIFANPIVRILFARGSFDDNAVHMTSNALFYFSIGFIGWGLTTLLVKFFYAMQDTKTSMITSIIAMIINIILNIILSRYMGIGGIALATSISMIFRTGLLFICLRKKMGSFGFKRIYISFIKVLFSSLLMGLIAKVTFSYFITIISQNFSLIVSIVIGIITYSFIIYFMKIEDVDILVKSIKKKIKNSAA